MENLPDPLHLARQYEEFLETDNVLLQKYHRLEQELSNLYNELSSLDETDTAHEQQLVNSVKNKLKEIADCEKKLYQEADSFKGSD